MSAKIVFIGAGSFVFTRAIVRDMTRFANLHDARIVLMDISPDRLEMARQCCRRILDVSGSKIKLAVTGDRQAALKDADVVITTILCGGTDIWKHDVLIPKKYGVDLVVGDTRGPSGIFRMLRTLPEMLRICADIRRLCPQALLLNYTNPMAMLCHGMQREFPDLNITGLCHGVQHTAAKLAGWLGLGHDDVDYTCAGINHMAFFTEFKQGHRDLYPRLRKLVATDKKIYNDGQVRNEMFLALDYYMTESSGHSSEYNWWFRKRPDLIKKYCTTGTCGNPGQHAFVLKLYQAKDKTWRTDLRRWLNQSEQEFREYVARTPVEYAAGIVSAWAGGAPFCFNGNVPNHGLISNVFQNACVEVPVHAGRRKLRPTCIGDLPVQLVPLVSLSATVEHMAVTGALQGDARLVCQAIAHDPLTASVLSLAEIRKMTAEMFKRNRAFLPGFRKMEL
ncbi:MAG: alpha-glucosidase/alpha-galactosidase [Lentisphaerae bacterium]|nr:alpha-glucosidase/alpha-galactosidase [Lentisphaerota bacterium]